MRHSCFGIQALAAGPRSLSLALALALTPCAPVLAQADPAALTARAAAAMAARDFDAAVPLADSAQVAAPERSSVQTVLGQAYLSHARAYPSLGAIGKVKKVRAALMRAIALDPDNLDARATLMQFLLQAPGMVGGSRDGARVQAREIAQRDPERGLLARLDVALAAGKKDEIIGVFDDAAVLLRLRPAISPTVGRAFFEAAGTLRHKELREPLAARIAAAVPAGVALTP